MNYDVIVVGGGSAGLTATAYLSRASKKVLLLEKEDKVGGLVNSFEYKGFTFDGGIRAIEDSGVIKPMIKQLGLDVEFLDSIVSVGIEDEVIKVKSKESLEDYKKLLSNAFSDNTKDIDKIIEEIKKIMGYMDLFYGIENPLFVDDREDKEYLLKTLLPWLFKVMYNTPKMNKLQLPVKEYLNNFTNNQALIDMISQSFFTDTPTSFALSYFSLYLDYRYPKGGTGVFIDKLYDFIIENNGEVKNNTEICYIDLKNKKVRDKKGNEYSYNKLIWANDLTKLYNIVDLNSIDDNKVINKINKKKKELVDKIGGNSILSVYVTADLDKSYFENICTGHFFYTAHKEGLSSLDIEEDRVLDLEKEEIIKWIKKYYSLTTYEIAIPSLRDETLAPKGKTGIMISTYMDYKLVKSIKDKGWYKEFKMLSEEYILDTLNESIFKGLKNKVEDKFSSTPLTIERITGSTHGAITGWAFTNSIIPVESKNIKIAKSVDTQIPDVYQAGQWSFSPSGLPISIITGKLAADKVLKYSN